MRLPFLALLVSGAVLGALPGIAQVQTAAPDVPPRQITVTGQGIVDVRPDMATLSLGVTTEGEAAGEALAANNAAMAAVMARLEEAGIAPRDMQTSLLNLSPRWTEPRDGGTRPEIDGYIASNALTVRVRELPALGDVISAAVADGANTFDGLSFGLAEPEPVEDEARGEAVADAERKARLFAEAAGVTLGPILSITEVTEFRGPIMMEQAAFARDASVPIAPGEVSLRATVTMSWGIE